MADETVYSIITMVGDYSVESQPEFSSAFTALNVAIEHAAKQHEQMAERWGDDDLYHTIIVTDGEGDPQAVYLICGDGIYTGEEAQRLSLILEEQDEPTAPLPE